MEDRFAGDPPSLLGPKISPSETKKSKRVEFGSVQIREYARTVGDNPSCSSGPPVSITWEYIPLPTLSLDDYEQSRGPRRSMLEMALPHKTRWKLLTKEWECQTWQVAAAVRSSLRIKNRRRTTVNQLSNMQVELQVEQVCRKVKSVFVGSTSRKSRELHRKHIEAVRQNQDQDPQQDQHQDQQDQQQQHQQFRTHQEEKEEYDIEEDQSEELAGDDRFDTAGAEIELQQPISDDYLLKKRENEAFAPPSAGEDDGCSSLTNTEYGSLVSQSVGEGTSEMLGQSVVL